MDTLLEQYGRTVLYAVIGVLIFANIAMFVADTDNPISDTVSDNFYSRSTETTNASNLSLVHPTITLKDSSYNTNSGNIHIYPEYSGVHNFKDDIILTDNGVTISSSNVHYRIMSVNLRNNNNTDNKIEQNSSGKPAEGYYMIKYWYRSPSNNTVATFITTVVVHNKY